MLGSDSQLVCYTESLAGSSSVWVRVFGCECLGAGSIVMERSVDKSGGQNSRERQQEYRHSRLTEAKSVRPHPKAKSQKVNRVAPYRAC